jgi:hypothetical protein
MHVYRVIVLSFLFTHSKQTDTVLLTRTKYIQVKVKNI